MSLFTLFEVLHVLCAILWVGGGFTLMVAVEVLRRRRGARDMMVLIDTVALLGPPFFVPLSALTVLFGAATAWLGYGFTEMWVLLGLAGAAVTSLTGFLCLKPRAERLADMMQRDEGMTARTLAAAEELVHIARFDYVMLGCVVAVMVLKPTEGDTMILAVLAGILVIGAMLTLGRARGAVRKAA